MYIVCSVGGNIIIIRLDYFNYFLNNLFKKKMFNFKIKELN